MDSEVEEGEEGEMSRRVKGDVGGEHAEIGNDGMHSGWESGCKMSDEVIGELGSKLASDREEQDKVLDVKEEGDEQTDADDLTDDRWVAPSVSNRSLSRLETKLFVSVDSSRLRNRFELTT